ncbi:hypothetical protein C8R43DRAFT_943037 [Mycena crocata]|nr:hypothetical protein C8R43DRAFT_943037 [Mycena crocata]
MRPTFFAFLTLAPSVLGDSSSSPAASKITSPASAGESLTQCGINCINNAAAQSPCGSQGNLTCLCTDLNFQAMAASCLAKCQPDQTDVGIALQKQKCGSLSLFASAGPTATATLPFTPSSDTGSVTPVTESTPFFASGLGNTFSPAYSSAARTSSTAADMSLIYGDKLALKAAVVVLAVVVAFVTAL